MIRTKKQQRAMDRFLNPPPHQRLAVSLFRAKETEDLGDLEDNLTNKKQSSPQREYYHTSFLESLTDPDCLAAYAYGLMTGTAALAIGIGSYLSFSKGDYVGSIIMGGLRACR